MQLNVRGKLVAAQVRLQLCVLSLRALLCCWREKSLAMLRWLLVVSKLDIVDLLSLPVFYARRTLNLSSPFIPRTDHQDPLRGDQLLQGRLKVSFW